MTSFAFKPATKHKSKLRLGLIGPSGSGKTYSALAIATGLGGRIAVIDTEHGSAQLYADVFKFEVLELESFAPETFVEAIHAAEDAGFDIIVIDSLSHAWMGKDGALEKVDNAAKRSQSGNTFMAWRDVTPKHNAMIDAIVGSKAHVIATMRAKTEYVIESITRGGRTIQQPRKVGLAPVQRDGMEYEFTVVGDIDIDHNFSITKTRCSALADKVFEKPGKQIADVLKAWLENGAPAPERAATAPSSAPAPAPDDEMPEWAKTKDEQPSMTAIETLISGIHHANTIDALKAYVPEVEKLEKGSVNRARATDAMRRRKEEIEKHAREAEQAAAIAEVPPAKTPAEIAADIIARAGAAQDKAAVDALMVEAGKLPRKSEERAQAAAACDAAHERVMAKRKAAKAG